jgi:ribosomal protein S18 acetylase RimI-like enzyme
MSNTSAFVRLATQSDAEVINQHRSSALIEAQQYRGFLTSSDPIGTELQFVAGYGTTVMGSARIFVIGTQADLHHVFVNPDAREVGLADLLITHILSDMKARGVSHVSGKALPGDRATKNLFERHGLIAQTIIVGKSL